MNKTKIASLAYIVYCCFVIFAAIFLWPPTWDEFLDFSGNVGAFNHGASFLKGQSTDITTITHDLEWYGNSYRWPAYFLWAILHEFPVRIPEGRFAYDSFLAGHYSGSIHVVSALYSCLGVFFFWKLLKRLRLSFSLAFLATIIFSSSPFWLSNSVWNVKDFPVAVASVVLLYLSLYPATGGLKNTIKSKALWWITCAFVMSTILANKYAYFPLVIIYSFIISFSFVTRGSGVFVRRTGSLKLFAKILFSTVTLFFLSYLVSIPMVPQGFGDHRYPLESIRYFLNHPLVLYDSNQSLLFLASRLSFLITLPVLILVFVALISIPLFLYHVLVSRRYTIGLSRFVVLLFFALPFLSYLVPIALSGRVLYGQDLRHLIWLYPSFLVLLSVIASWVLNSSSFRFKRVLLLILLLSIAVHVCEVLAIYPHFYTYKGVMPLSLESDVGDQRLIVSHYFPGRAPELHSSLLRRCFLEPACKSILSMHERAASSRPPLYFIDMDVGLNNAYFEAYLRLKDNIGGGRLYDYLGYSFDFKQNGDCLSLKYGKKFPVSIYSDALICGLKGQF